MGTGRPGFCAACLLAALTLASPVNASGLLSLEIGRASGADIGQGVSLGTFMGKSVWRSVGIGGALAGIWISRSSLVIPATGTTPDGRRIAKSYELRDASIDLFPFAPRVYATIGDAPLSALVGVEGGYLLGFVEAQAFQTQIFGGWGGKACASVWRMLPRSDASLGLGLVTEYRVGTIRREAYDRDLGARVRQELDTGGWTIALGLRVDLFR